MATERRFGVDDEQIKRRDDVARLLTWGYTARAIAKTLNVSDATIRRDIDAIRVDLQRNSLDSLGDRIRRSVENRRMVQREAIALFHTLPAISVNRVGTLNTYLAAQDTIDKLEGTTSPDSVNTAALSEAYEALVTTLDAVAAQLGLDPTEVQKVYSAHLRRRVGTSSQGLVLGAQVEDAPVVVADVGDDAPEDTAPDDGDGDDSA